jgi:hypothetical protein
MVVCLSHRIAKCNDMAYTQNVEKLDKCIHLVTSFEYSQATYVRAPSIYIYIFFYFFFVFLFSSSAPRPWHNRWLWLAVSSI